MTGLYKVQLWGAGGGGWWWYENGTRCNYGDPGGTGGFYVKLNKGETIYINVGGAGKASAEGGYRAGGWNGGGRGGNLTEWTNVFGASGAGATSVQTTNRGELRNYAGAQGEVLAVVGGGAGGTSNVLLQNGGSPGSITSNTRGEILQGQNRQPHGPQWWVEGVCW